VKWLPNIAAHCWRQPDGQALGSSGGEKVRLVADKGQCATGRSAKGAGEASAMDGVVTEATDDDVIDFEPYE